MTDALEQIEAYLQTYHTDRREGEVLRTAAATIATQREEIERLTEMLAKLGDRQELPKVYDFLNLDDVEATFDVGHRHRSGSQPVDYLKSWLGMFRPFAFASRSDSWGELEKLICIVLRNYVQGLADAREARALLAKLGE